jgi:WD40 repeat protein
VEYIPANAEEAASSALVKRLALFPNKSAGIRAIIPSKRDESIAVKLAFCIASQHRFCGLSFNSSPECSATLSEHTDWITSVAFHPSGCYIATCSRDKTIRLWRLNRGGTAAQCVSTIRVDTPASHELTANFSISAQFHPSAPYIAIASEDGISLWRLDTDCVKAKSTLRLPTKSRVRNGLHSVAFHPWRPISPLPVQMASICGGWNRTALQRSVSRWCKGKD